MIRKISLPFLVLLLVVLGVFAMGDATASARAVEIPPAEIARVAAGLNIPASPFENPIAPSAPSASGECSDEDPGAKMKCQFKKYSDALCSVNDAAQADTTGILAVQKDKFEKYCDTTQAWLETPGREEFFKNSFKKKDVACYIEEIDYDLIGDNDGVCTRSEQNKDGCAEEMGDGIGDDDGKCEARVPGKGKKVREPCVQICESEETEDPEDDELIDTASMEMVGSSLEIAAGDLEKMGDATRSMLQEFNAVTYNSPDAQTLPVHDPDKCMGMLLYEVNPYSPLVMARVGPIFYTTEERPLSYRELDTYRTKVTTNAILGETCDDAFAAELPGGSTQAWCSVLHAVDAVIVEMADGLAFLDDEITGTRIDNTVKCLQYVSKKLQSSQSALDYKVEWRRLHMQVVELKEKQEFLVHISEFGRADHTMAAGYRLRVSGKASLAFVDITSATSWTELEDGVYLVKVNLPQSQKNAEMFWFEAWHTEQMLDQDRQPILDDAGSPLSVEHSGSLIYDRTNPGSGGSGQ